MWAVNARDLGTAINRITTLMHLTSCKAGRLVMVRMGLMTSQWVNDDTICDVTLLCPPYEFK
jgi:hypothetical protein